MAGFAAADAPSHAAIVDSFHHWDDIDVHIHGAIDPHRRPRFCGHRAQAAAQHPAAAGRESRRRAELPARGRGRGGVCRCRSADRGRRRQQPRSPAVRGGSSSPTSTCASAASSGSGTTQQFPAFTFAFERTEHGWFQIHAYQFSKDLSTVIVETREETWRAHGLDRATTRRIDRVLPSGCSASISAAQRLMSNARHLRGSAWLNFNRVLCRRWFTRNVVLIGDAAHTAHFSIGSGTKLAMEDAIALSREVARGGDVGDGAASLPGGARARSAQAAERGAQSHGVVRERRALHASRAAAVHVQPADRQPAHRSRQSEAARRRHSSATSSDGSRSARCAGPQLCRRCSCRSSCASWSSTIASWCRRWRSTRPSTACPTTGISCITARARLAARVSSLTEMTCVSPHGRISPGCTGLWNEAQRDAWRRIVDFVHEHTHAKFCLQLGHSGRKGSTQLGWEQADYPLRVGQLADHRRLAACRTSTA